MNAYSPICHIISLAVKNYTLLHPLSVSDCPIINVLNHAQSTGILLTHIDIFRKCTHTRTKHKPN